MFPSDVKKKPELTCLYLGRTSARVFQSTADLSAPSLSSSAGPLPSLDVEGTWVSYVERFSLEGRVRASMQRVFKLEESLQG